MKKLIRTVVVYLACCVFSGGVLAGSPMLLQQTTTINSLSKELLSARLRHDGLRNAMVSSVSLYYALSVLREGAGGETADVLDTLLLANTGATSGKVAPMLAEILMSQSMQSTGTGVFQLANSVWSTNGESNGRPFVFAEPFMKSVASRYAASAHAIDFLQSGSSSFINRWAEENTNGLIPEIIDDATLCAFKWLIINAAYFEGSWGTSMRAIPAKDDRWFTALDGKEIATDSVKTSDFSGRVLDGTDGSIAFLLPFLGRKFSFVVYMPGDDESDIGRWLIEEGVANMPGVVEQVYANQSAIFDLSIRMPKFSFSDQLVMRKGSVITRELGLAPLFSDAANYSALVNFNKTHPSSINTTVGIIKQDTRIELDENGVKAAAVTLVGGIKSTTIGPIRQPRSIDVDRPFAFSIVENSSQTILFNGILTAPKQSR